MGSGAISFYSFLGTIALVFGFASLPRGFTAVGLVAAAATLAAVVLLQG